jgi:hypothetical protein
MSSKLYTLAALALGKEPVVLIRVGTQRCDGKYKLKNLKCLV